MWLVKQLCFDDAVTMLSFIFEILVFQNEQWKSSGIEKLSIILIALRNMYVYKLCHLIADVSVLAKTKKTIVHCLRTFFKTC